MIARLRTLRNKYTVLLHDLLMIPIAWLGAYWLRFNLEQFSGEFLDTALSTLPLVWIAQATAFWYFGLYRGIWRFASIPDFVRIAKAVVAGVALAAVGIFIINRLEGVPRSVFVLYPGLMVLLLGTPRLFYRWLRDRALYLDTSKKRVLVVGAGKAGEMLVRDMQQGESSGNKPVAFVDDDPNKIGREVRGVPVYGNCDGIPELVEKHDIDLILIALTTATSKQLRRIVEKCEATEVPFRSLPRLQDLVSGRVSLKELREVTIEDLLGRDPVQLDWETITKELSGKTVLVTGGGGSIGSELCRQILRLGPKRLVVLDNSEFNLFSIDLELRRANPSMPLVSVLGDVKDCVTIGRLFEQYHPDIVFHAAAYKHVPLLEEQSRSAVTNNALGTQIVADCAVKHGCGEFVLISTDKAVNPTNIMGATKRVAEIYCQSLSKESSTKFITVRFGNVLGSAGSVIPIFRSQISKGGPVTVTHPEIERYFMTIPEASQLILQAGGMGQGGEIYVLDMGEPVKISYLAEKMITLSGKQPGEDVEIVYTGLRPGEKMYEELFHESENLEKTSHPKILKAGSRQVERDDVNAAFVDLEKACNENNETEINRVLLRLVPEKENAVHEKEDNVIPMRGKTKNP